MRLPVLALTSALALTQLPWSTATAGTVSVEASSGQRILTVAVTDAPVEQVLSRLSEIKPFKIDTVGGAFDPTPLTNTFTGSLSSVIEQLLDHKNHLIYTNARSREVERIVVFGADAPDPSAQPSAQAAIAAATPPGQFPPVDPAPRQAQAGPVAVQTGPAALKQSPQRESAASADASGQPEASNTSAAALTRNATVTGNAAVTENATGTAAGAASSATGGQQAPATAPAPGDDKTVLVDSTGESTISSRRASLAAAGGRRGGRR